MGRAFKIEPSERITRLPPYLFGRLNRLRHQMRQDGADVIDLGMGNPNDPTPEPIVEALCKAARDKRNQRYSVSIGIYNLRREVAKHYEKLWGVKLDPDKEVVALIGSKEGYSHLCLALMGRGETAVVPDPAFPIHIYSMALAGANVIRVPLEPRDSLVGRIADVAENLYPRPKVVVLNFPHNPTTATVELDFFKDVVRVARKHNLIVIHDFAYSETVFDGYHPPSFLQVRGAKSIGVEFTTMSKAYNMAGWRIGFCVGNRKILEGLSRIKGYYDYGIFQPVQIASIIALRQCGHYAEEQSARYQKRRDVLCDGLRRIGWDVEPPKATMFVWARMPERFRRMKSIPFCMKLLEEAEVAVAPGRAFGESGEGSVRFALVENQHRIRQAIRQIGRVTK
jgi:alanine-synthesizing transaminase